MKISILWIIAIALQLGDAVSAHAQMVVFQDGTFANADWSIVTFTYGQVGSVSATQVATGGNPGSYRFVTDNVPNPGSAGAIVHGLEFNPSFTFSPRISGPPISVSYSLDYGTENGAQVGVGLAAEQGGKFFLGGYRIVTGGPWQTFQMNSLTSGSFQEYTASSPLINLPPGPATLNFSAGAAPITFGFVTANSSDPGNSGYSASIHIDNFAVSVAYTSVPEPFYGRAVGFIVIGLAVWRRATVVSS